MSANPRTITRGLTSTPPENAAWPASWNTMAHGIGVGRYIDPEFARLEYEKLWNRVWQIAARVDEIPEKGDYTTYKIGDQSVLLVRVDESTIKAYHNFCPHRGTTLGQGCGHYEDEKIICPFHGWRWDLSGNTKLVLERNEFRDGKLRDSDVALKEVHAVVFAGFVFINLDRSPEPFEQFIAPMRAALEGLAIGDMHHYWWKSAPVPANWKIAQDAFFEAYHVSATHPQLEKVGRDVVYGDRGDGDMMYRNIRYEVFPQGHGLFFGGDKTPGKGYVQEPKGDLLEEMAARMMLNADGMDAMILKEDVDLLLSLRGKPLPPGATLGSEYVRLQYEHAAEQGRPMPKRSPEILALWSSVIFIFPNFIILPQAGNACFYRVRPDGLDPNRCTFEIFSTKTLPANVKPQRATVINATALDDPEQLRLIPRQDMSNIPRVQEGLHSKAMHQTWLAVNQEKLILNMHQEMDRYLRA